MKRHLLIMVTTAALLLAPAVQAEGWQGLWRQLDGWDGGRTVAMSTDLADPYASAAYRRLVNGFVERGFAVRQADRAAAPERGLRVELQQTDSGLVIAVTEVAEGSLLLVNRLPGQEPPADDASGAGSEPVTRPEAAASAGREGRMQRLSLDGHPVRLAALPGTPGKQDDGVRLALLYSDRLEWGQVADGSFIRAGRFRVEASGTDGLYIGAGDHDGDPAPEIVALWGENRHVPSQGWSTRLVGRVLEVDGEGIRPETPVLRRYLRVVSGSILAQKRTEYATHAGPVRRLEANASGDFVAGEEVPGWQGRWLYAVTPLAQERTALWRGPDRLAIKAAPEPDSPMLGEIQDLGKLAGPAVTTRLREPDTGNGPDVYERQSQREAVLPRRVLADRDGALYTIRRGRRESWYMQAMGSDSVIRLEPASGNLRGEEVHEPVEDYILDFDLVQHQGGAGQTLFLLVNEEADGSGAASLIRVDL